MVSQRYNITSWFLLDLRLKTSNYYKVHPKFDCSKFKYMRAANSAFNVWLEAFWRPLYGKKAVLNFHVIYFQKFSSSLRSKKKLLQFWTKCKECPEWKTKENCTRENLDIWFSLFLIATAKIYFWREGWLRLFSFNFGTLSLF